MVDHVEQPRAVIFALGDMQAGHRRAQAGERVLDFMRHIGGKLFVGVDPVVKRRDHTAHGARKPPDFVGPRGQVGNAHATGAHLAGVRSRPISAAAARSLSGLAMVEASTRLSPIETMMAITNI